MLVLQGISYVLPNQEVLLNNINIAVNRSEKIALVGNNGSGKSTLLKIISGHIPSTRGQRIVESTPYLVPQIFGQFDHFTVSQAMGLAHKIKALREILRGDATASNLDILDDDWDIEERSARALADWDLGFLDLDQPVASLSGGQKTKAFLAGIQVHKPDLILLDEPSNHLDTTGREQLYQFVQSTESTLVVVSHDRKLLQLIPKVCELTRDGIHVYGGNYDFYVEQKQIESDALYHDIHSQEKALRKAKEKERETIERQQKLDARGKKKQEKAGIARIMMNTLRNKAENSTAKIADAHTEKVSGIKDSLMRLRAVLPDTDKIKLGFDDSSLHKGKMLFAALGINFSYHTHKLWKESLTVQINSGERIALKGNNGSGKTTLIKIILNELEPVVGQVIRAGYQAVYIDQDYSLIDNQLTTYEQAQQFNADTLQEHEVKIRLNRFLFPKEDWNKPCCALSGGERMRLSLCCLTLASHSPDILILDEPTNNLDIQNIEILTSAIREYKGTLLVVSHDEVFRQQIDIDKEITLS